MARTKILVGNWKMNNTIAESKVFCESASLIAQASKEKGIEVGVAPSYLSIQYVKEHVEGIDVYSQDAHYKEKGAYTSSVAIPMLEEVGVVGAIIGHSERRAYEGETNEVCNLKIKALLAHNMKAIYCVGETEAQFDQGITKEVIKEQVTKGLEGVDHDGLDNIVIAYEPVWAIGTGKNASKEIAQDICHYIREVLTSLYCPKCASKVRIMYGGSVKPNNIHEYLLEEDVDGALVGGASLTAASFAELVKNI